MRKLASKTLLRNRLGEERVITKFLWFPYILDNKNNLPEWRWLETVNIRQKIMAVDVGGSMEYGNYAYCWRSLCWED